MTDRVATSAEYLAQAKKDPKKIVTVDFSKPKPVKGSIFYDTKTEIATGRGPSKTGLIAVVLDKTEDDKDVLIPLVSIKAEEEHKRAEMEKGKSFSRLQMKFRVSESGDYGKATMLHSNEFTRQTSEFVTALTEEKDTDELKRKKIKGAAQTNVSKAAKENAGAVIEDPYISHKVDFSNKWPERHPRKSLQSKPKTQLLDYDTKFVNPTTGAIEFLPAMLEDEDGKKTIPVTNENVHLFINKGSSLYRGRVYLDSVCASATAISQTRHMVYAVVKRGSDDVGTDDVEMASPEEIAAAKKAAEEANRAAEEAKKDVNDQEQDGLEALLGGM